MLEYSKIIVISLIGQIVGFFFYLIIAYLTTDKFCPDRLFSYQTFKEIDISFNAFKIGVPVAISIKYLVMPYLQIYHNFFRFNLIQTCILFILYFILFDLLNYFLHRLLHTRVFYKNVHLVHHKFKEPTPFGSIAVHPIEFVLNSVIPSTIVSFFLPTYIYLWMFSYLFHTIWTIIIHDGIKYNKNDVVLMDSIKHGIHHQYPLRKYAFIFHFWDIIFGTD